MDTRVDQGALYRAMLQQAGDAVFLLDAATMAVVEANAAAERMSGYRRAELYQLDLSRLLTVGSPGRAGLPAAKVVVVGLPEFEGYVQNRDGSCVPVSVGVSEVAHADTRYFLLIARDIGERRRQAHQVAQTEKLAGMERLTASIAHEINNPLQALHNSLHLLLSRTFSEERREQLLSMAQSEVDRLIVLVQRMLEFHRPSREGMRPVSIHGLLEGALSASAEQIQRHGVSVERDWAERLPWVIGIGGHLKQVFLSLVANAIDAMPDGGRLIVRTRLEESAPDSALWVLVEFVDSGPGIPESEARMLFEPFNISKKAGAGLGLALSYSIVEQHGGTLSLRSDGGSTTFRVMLPVAADGSRQ